VYLSVCHEKHCKRSDSNVRVGPDWVSVLVLESHGDLMSRTRTDSLWLQMSRTVPAVDLLPAEGFCILIGPDAQMLHPQSDIISAPPAERFTEQHLMTGVGTVHTPY